MLTRRTLLQAAVGTSILPKARNPKLEQAISSLNECGLTVASVEEENGRPVITVTSTVGKICDNMRKIVELSKDGILVRSITGLSED